MSTTTPTTINSWSEVKQKLFLGDKEIVNASKRVQPHKGAQAITYVTKDGVTKQFYYAEQVDILDTAALREVEKQKRELFKLYMQHEIGLNQFNEAMAQLEK